MIGGGFDGVCQAPLPGQIVAGLAKVEGVDSDDSTDEADGGDSSPNESPPDDFAGDEDFFLSHGSGSRQGGILGKSRLCQF